jgi:hypothetical protein
MSDPIQPGTPAPGAQEPGIFLPTLIWTTDRKTVGNEMQRLLGRRAQLNALLSDSEEADDGTTWYAMAQATLYQLDCDIEHLFEWLGDYEPDAPTPEVPSEWPADGSDPAPAGSLDERGAKPAGLSPRGERSAPPGARRHQAESSGRRLDSETGIHGEDESSR